MDHVFISYSSKDRPKIRGLVDILEKQGLKVWWDKKIPPGKRFDQVISKALDEASCILVVWSPNSVASDWVLEESFEGLERKILIPAMIGKTPLPFGYRRMHYVDLTRWKGSVKAKPVLDLVTAVSSLVVPPVPKPAKKTATGKKKAVAKKKPARPKKRKRRLSGALDGKTIVFTGTLSESRRIHAEKVKVVGANFVDTVSGNTDYLVAGKEPGAVKLKAAEKHKVKKISEKKWLQMLNDAYQRTLLGKQIVFTGKLASPRTDLEKLAKKIGAKPMAAISGKTDFLIVGDKPGKVKLDAAKKFSVQIIKEDLWKEIIATL